MKLVPKINTKMKTHFFKKKLHSNLLEYLGFFIGNLPKVINIFSFILYFLYLGSEEN